MKILVTGGAGFIGSNIVKRLLELGHEPVVLDNLSSGYKENLFTGVTLIEGDVRNLNILVEAADQSQKHPTKECFRSSDKYYRPLNIRRLEDATAPHTIVLYHQDGHRN